MEEPLETIESSQDKKLVKDLKAALKKVDEGKAKLFYELTRKLDL